MSSGTTKPRVLWSRPDADGHARTPGLAEAASASTLGLLALQDGAVEPGGLVGLRAADQGRLALLVLVLVGLGLHVGEDGVDDLLGVVDLAVDAAEGEHFPRGGWPCVPDLVVRRSPPWAFFTPYFSASFRSSSSADSRLVGSLLVLAAEHRRRRDQLVRPVVRESDAPPPPPIRKYAPTPIAATPPPRR